MLKGSYADLGAFIEKHPEFKTALAEAKKYEQAECGRHDISGDDLYVSVQRYTTVAYGDKDFENHKRYIDMQYVVSGRENIYVCDKREADVTKVYDDAGDYELLKEKPEAKVTCVTLAPGDFLVLYPDEPHKPGITTDAPSKVGKIVIKVKY